MILSGIDGHICQPPPRPEHTNTRTMPPPHLLTIGLLFALQPPSPRLIYLLLCSSSPHTLSALKSPTRPQKIRPKLCTFFFLLGLRRDQTGSRAALLLSVLCHLFVRKWFLFILLVDQLTPTESVVLIWFMKHGTPGKPQLRELTYVAVQHDSRLQ